MNRTRSSTSGLLPHALKAGILVCSASVTVSAYSTFRPQNAPSVSELAESGLVTCGAVLNNGIQGIHDKWTSYWERHPQEEVSNGSENTKNALSVDVSSDAEDSVLTGSNGSSDTGNSDFPLPEGFHYTDNDYNVLLDTAMGPMLYFNQHDSHWGNYLIGGRDSLAHYGCGPTVVAMILNSFSDDPNVIEPQEIADWAVANREYAPGGGSYHSLISNALIAYGMEVVPVTDITPDTIRSELSAGHLLIALMGKGSFTNTGHFLLLAKTTSDGLIYVADTNNFENCQRPWSPEQLISEMKYRDRDGGPLWSVRRNPS